MSNPFSPLPNSNPNSPATSWSSIGKGPGSTFQPYPAVVTQTISYGYGQGGYGQGGYGGTATTIVNQPSTLWTPEVIR